MGVDVLVVMDFSLAGCVVILSQAHAELTGTNIDGQDG